MKQVRKGKYTKKLPLKKRVTGFLQDRYSAWKKLSRKKKALLIASPFVIFVIVIPVITYLYYVHDISDQERLMNRNNTGVVFLDRDGNEFYSIGMSKQHDLVPLDKISVDLQHALVASEDKDFYNHGGFSVLSTLRAIYGYVLKGGGSYGGSTITQQLAKITLLSNTRSVFRQYQAFTVAQAIENTYTKDQILDMYLNSVYFGENVFGIEDAAQLYFGKTPAELDLAESAMLIGLLPAPNAYSPINGSEKLAKSQQESVLTRMVDNGYITEAQKTSALAEKLTYAKQSTTSNIAPHFTEMVLKELTDKYGYEEVMRSGYQVQTTLDSSLQKILNKNIQNHISYIDAHGGSNASAVAIDPSTGKILALVGSANYSNTSWGKVNMATTARQPASTFKAIYYAGALAEGVITPSTILSDRPINIDGWQPHDADGKYRGDVTVRNAINLSLNIPSIEVMQKYGIDKSIQQAKDLGITTLSSSTDYGLPLAIGSGEVPLLEMTNAYATFADQGIYHDTSLITSVKDKYNKKIYTAPTPTAKQGISQAGAYLISDILSDNAAKAPFFGDSFKVAGHTVAVKSGTNDEVRDTWTIGYTPSLAIGVWVGNNDNSAMSGGSSTLAAPIWKGSMTDALAGTSDEQFTRPSTVVERSTCYSNHGLATNSITNGTYNEYYLASALPTTTCTPAEPTISVCVLATGEVTTIKESDYDDKTYSKDTNNCKKPDPTISVCDLSTGQVTTIKESEYNASSYSKDTTNCVASGGTDPTGATGGGGSATTTP